MANDLRYISYDYQDIQNDMNSRSKHHHAIISAIFVRQFVDECHEIHMALVNATKHKEAATAKYDIAEAKYHSWIYRITQFIGYASIAAIIAFFILFIYRETHIEMLYPTLEELDKGSENFSKLIWLGFFPTWIIMTISNMCFRKTRTTYRDALSEYQMAVKIEEALKRDMISKEHDSMYLSFCANTKIVKDNPLETEKDYTRMYNAINFCSALLFQDPDYIDKDLDDAYETYLKTGIDAE